MFSLINTKNTHFQGLTPFMVTNLALLACFLISSCKSENKSTTSNPTQISNSVSTSEKRIISKNVHIDGSVQKSKICDIAGKKNLNSDDFAKIENGLRELANSDPFQVLDFFSSDYPNFGAYDFASKVLNIALSNINHTDLSIWIVKQPSDSYAVGLAMDEIAKANDPVIIQDLLDTTKKSSNIEMLNVLFSSLAKNDPQQAIDILDQSNLSQNQKNELNGQIALTISHDDPESAIVMLKSRPKQNTDPGVYAMIVAHWVNSDSDAAFDHIRKSNPDDLVMLLMNPISKGFMMKRENLKNILDILEVHALTSDVIPAHRQVIVELSRNNAAQALDSLTKINSSPYKNNLIKDVISTIAKTNLNEALSFVGKLSADEKHQGMRGIAATLAVEDFDAAIKLAGTEVDITSRDMLREIARVSVGYNSQNAVTMIENDDISAKVGTDFRNEIIKHTVQNWAKQDREAAQQWVEKLPVADQSKGVQGLVASWMKTDPIAASEWLSQQPAGPARDAGAQEIINQIKDTDPEMAEQWRKSMTPKTE
jgi:hypothetical protein